MVITRITSIQEKIEKKMAKGRSMIAHTLGRSHAKEKGLGRDRALGGATKESRMHSGAACSYLFMNFMLPRD